VLRVQNRAACDAEVARHTRTWQTSALDTRLAEVGIPAAQVNDVRGLVEHPQLVARDRWRQVETENGPVRALLPPATFSDVEAPMGAVPALGEHTVAVLREVGLDDSSIDRLIESGSAVQHHSQTEGVNA
jgi:itaconate CoA-transferase